MATLAELQAAATEIRDETGAKANTASRVGSFCLDVVNSALLSTDGNGAKLNDFADEISIAGSVLELGGNDVDEICLHAKVSIHDGSSCVDLFEVSGSDLLAFGGFSAGVLQSAAPMALAHDGNSSTLSAANANLNLANVSGALYPQLVFSVDGVVGAGLQSGIAGGVGNLYVHATGSQGTQFFGSLGITTPLGAITGTGFVTGGGAGQTAAAKFHAISANGAHVGFMHVANASQTADPWQLWTASSAAKRLWVDKDYNFTIEDETGHQTRWTPRLLKTTQDTTNATPFALGTLSGTANNKQYKIGVEAQGQDDSGKMCEGRWILICKRVSDVASLIGQESSTHGEEIAGVVGPTMDDNSGDMDLSFAGAPGTNIRWTNIRTWWNEFDCPAYVAP